MARRRLLKRRLAIRLSMTAAARTSSRLPTIASSAKTSPGSSVIGLPLSTGDAQKRRASGCGGAARSNDLEQRAVEPVIFGARQKMRPQPARLEDTAQSSIGGFTLVFVTEQFLSGDDVALHTDNFDDFDDAPYAVAHTGDLGNQVDRGGNLSAHRM